MKSQIQFIKSAVHKSDYPKSTWPEVAIVGRSNAGKSSLINALAHQKVAKVSQQPGKTLTLNFFAWDEKAFLVDMPGYGFARRSNKEMELWQEMIEGYLVHRKNLRGVLLVMDVRRKWSEEEDQLAQWVRLHNRKLTVILNKCDKATQSERTLAERAVTAVPAVDSVHCVSALKGKGLVKLTEYVFANWLKEIQ